MPNPFTGRGSIRRLIADLAGAVLLASIIPAAFFVAAFFN